MQELLVCIKWSNYENVTKRIFTDAMKMHEYIAKCKKRDGNAVIEIIAVNGDRNNA